MSLFKRFHSNCLLFLPQIFHNMKKSPPLILYYNNYIMINNLKITKFQLLRLDNTKIELKKKLNV